jgi:hypothetical protein
MKFMKISLTIFGIVVMAWSCSKEELATTDSAISQTAIDLAQTSGQLASGTSFSIAGSSTDSTNAINHGPGKHSPRKHHGILDGLNLLAPTDELLAIIDAESAGDIRGFRISRTGGATVTHYNADGEIVTLPVSEQSGPQGCSLSGGQFPEFDSLLSTIVKTEIDFATGATFARDTITIFRAGKIMITRETTGSATTEVTTFENYSVNGIAIAGTKTRISTFDPETGSGSSVTTVEGGTLTFADGTSASWTSDKSRTSGITLGDDEKPESGTITTEVNTNVVSPDGTVIYSHKTNAPLIESIDCGHRRAPVSGVFETIYREDAVAVNFGDGTCSNRTITITFNGVTTTKTIGG